MNYLSEHFVSVRYSSKPCCSHCVQHTPYANTNPICVAELSIYGENGGKCAATIHTRIKVKCHFGLPRSGRNGKSVQRLVRARVWHHSKETAAPFACHSMDLRFANDMKSDDFEIIAVERRPPLFSQGILAVPRLAQNRL